MTKAASLIGCGLCLLAASFLLTRSGGYEFSFAGARLTYAGPGRRDQKLKGVVLFFFRAHGEKCRSDDHSEKYQCKNKIVDHWGSLLFGGFGRL
jgi:hypothetical protein